ncbi:hypothetical protein [Sanguibacter massiliensis]|uniref:hypothetical protein n=1 Tax=Sanguibacter massiliensis TaxID=1973217 RepID=UPI003BF5996B
MTARVPRPTRSARTVSSSRATRIPMSGAASSLNAANAATVVLYEAARQRGAAGRRG